MEKVDPRYKNQLFYGGSASQYFEQYREGLSQALKTVNLDALNQAFMLLKKTIEGNDHVFVCGNGGSAAIADHLCCDFTKGTRAPNQPTLRTHSLLGSTALLTAISNDFTFEEVFSAQLEMFSVSSRDVLIVISSSGNSPNILNAVKMAKHLGIQVIGLSGFTGGALAQVSDISLYIHSQNYGIIEDCHQALMHSISQFLAITQDRASSKEGP